MLLERQCPGCGEIARVEIEEATCPFCGSSYDQPADVDADHGSGEWETGEPEGWADPPLLPARYSLERSARVIRRLQLLADAIRWRTALAGSITGAVVGLVVGSVVERYVGGGQGIGAVTGVLLGGFCGFQLGAWLADMRVVWIEWAEQMLSALDHLAQTSKTQTGTRIYPRRRQ